MFTPPRNGAEHLVDAMPVHTMIHTGEAAETNLIKIKAPNKLRAANVVGFDI
uniref:Uncharacterized protein n=1 Tax=Parascaris univalens TaxID=6257 RepID=A0A914ZZ71_PARUN